MIFHARRQNVQCFNFVILQGHRPSLDAAKKRKQTVGAQFKVGDVVFEYERYLKHCITTPYDRVTVPTKLHLHNGERYF